MSSSPSEHLRASSDSEPSTPETASFDPVQSISREFKLDPNQTSALAQFHREASDPTKLATCLARLFAQSLSILDKLSRPKYCECRMVSDDSNIEPCLAEATKFNYDGWESRSPSLSTHSSPTANECSPLLLDAPHLKQLPSDEYLVRPRSPNPQTRICLPISKDVLPDALRAAIDAEVDLAFRSDWLSSYVTIPSDIILDRVSAKNDDDPRVKSAEASLYLMSRADHTRAAYYNQIVASVESVDKMTDIFSFVATQTREPPTRSLFSRAAFLRQLCREKLVQPDGFWKEASARLKEIEERVSKASHYGEVNDELVMYLIEDIEECPPKSDKRRKFDRWSDPPECIALETTFPRACPTPSR